MSYRLDAELTVGHAEVAAERRVQVHLGTREAPARVVDLGASGVQLRLEQPLLALCRDRLVVRRIAPQGTLGGGVVLDPAPPRHGPGWTPRPEGEAARSAPRAPPSHPEPGPLARRLLDELVDAGERPPGAAALAERLDTDRRDVERARSELIASADAIRVNRMLFTTQPATPCCASGLSRLPPPRARPTSPRYATRSASAANTPRRCSTTSTASGCCVGGATGITQPKEKFEGLS
jgi:hypothetical protein